MSKTLTLSQFVPVKQKSKRVNVVSKVITTLTPHTTPSKRTGAVKSKLSNAWLYFVTLSLVAVNVAFLVNHVVNTNAYAVKGYEITRLRNEVTRLTQENKKLTLEVAEITSIVGVQQSMTLARFVPITNTEFIKSTTPKVSER